MRAGWKVLCLHLWVHPKLCNSRSHNMQLRTGWTVGFGVALTRKWWTQLVLCTVYSREYCKQCLSSVELQLVVFMMLEDQISVCSAIRKSRVQARKAVLCMQLYCMHEHEYVQIWRPTLCVARDVNVAQRFCQVVFLNNAHDVIFHGLEWSESIIQTSWGLTTAVRASSYLANVEARSQRSLFA